MKGHFDGQNKEPKVNAYGRKRSKSGGKQPWMFPHDGGGPRKKIASSGKRGRKR